MRTTNMKYAREHLQSLVDEVIEGREVVVTRRGEPVVRLTPVEESPRRLPSLASFRSSIRVQGRALSQDVVAARAEERH